MTHKVDVQTAIFDAPISFEFATREQAEAFQAQVRTYGLHLNVEAARIRAPEGTDQTIGAQPLGVETRMDAWPSTNSDGPDG